MSAGHPTADRVNVNVILAFTDKLSFDEIQELIAALTQRVADFERRKSDAAGSESSCSLDATAGAATSTAVRHAMAELAASEPQSKTLTYSDPERYASIKMHIQRIARTLAMPDYGGCLFTLSFNDTARTITATDDPQAEPGQGVAQFLIQICALSPSEDFAPKQG